MKITFGYVKPEVAFEQLSPGQCFMFGKDSEAIFMKLSLTCNDNYVNLETGMRGYLYYRDKVAPVEAEVRVLG